MIKFPWFAATLAISVGTSAPALAQQVTDGWRVSVTPYLWVSSYEGDVTDRSNGQDIDTSASFGDLLSNLEFVFIGKGEVQYDRVGVLGDLVYLKLGADQTVERPLLGPIKREADVATTTVTVAGFYRIAFSDSKTVWQVLGTYNYQWKPNLTVSAGYRYFVIDLDRPRADVDVTLKGPLLGLTYVF